MMVALGVEARHVPFPSIDVESDGCGQPAL